MVSRIVFTVVIAARVADQPSGYISWIVFAALLISGITTVLQAIRVGRVGAGHVLIMGSSGAFISVCVAALLEAGPATMASLVLVSSLLNFTLASRLPMLRRIFTPVVSGSVMMLISASIFPCDVRRIHGGARRRTYYSRCRSRCGYALVCNRTPIASPAFMANLVAVAWHRSWLRSIRCVRIV